MGAVTERKYAHGRPAPSLTPDRDEAKCHVRPEWFDELVQPKADPEVVEAIKHTCDACPLQVGCWAENAEEGWLKRVKGERRERQAAAARVGWAERIAARIDKIEGLLNAGADVHAVSDALGIGPESLYKWCHKHKRPDLFRSLPGSADAMPSQLRRKARGEAAA